MKHSNMDLLTNQVICFMFVIYANQFSIGKPVNYGFTLKLNPSAFKDQFKQKIFGTLYTKLPHPTKPPNGTSVRTSDKHLSKQVLPDSLKSVTQMLSPVTDPNVYLSQIEHSNVVSNHMKSSKFDQFNVIVAAAPSMVKLNGDEAKPLLVYIVFSSNNPGNNTKVNIPKIFFVHKAEKIEDIVKQPKAEPVLIVDSNRTVTGLKSYEVAKFVKFKNKLTNKHHAIETQP